MAKNAIEILVTAQDQATGQVSAIFDAYGRAARKLEESAAGGTQAVERFGVAVQRHGESFSVSSRHVQHLARVIGFEFSESAGHAAGTAATLTTAMHGLPIALTLAATAAAGLAAIFGGQLV